MSLSCSLALALPLKQGTSLVSSHPSLFFTIASAIMLLPASCNLNSPQNPSSLLIMATLSATEADTLSRPPLPAPLHPCEVKVMVERFAKLLLGEDFSGGRKGVSTALAISNAITNLSASVFGQLWKLEPLAAEKRMMWYREMDWLLCVSDSIVELIPSIHESTDGRKVEVMASRQRSDIYASLPALKKLDVMLLGILDEFSDADFFYVSRGTDGDNETSSVEPSFSGRHSIRLEEKWWLPFPKVPSGGLSETARKRLQQCRDCVNQMHKAASAINSSVLAEMEIPDAYLNNLPKSAKACLGEVMYPSMINDNFCPQRFLDYYLGQLSEHATLEIANRIETAIHIWKRKFRKGLFHAKGGKSSWSSKVKGLVHDTETDKFRILAQRAESLLNNLRMRFADLPQTDLDRSKIQHNKDVGKSILESYSRVLESLSFNITALIDDIIYVDDATKKRAAAAEPHHNRVGLGFRCSPQADIT